MLKSNAKVKKQIQKKIWIFLDLELDNFDLLQENEILITEMINLWHPLLLHISKSDVMVFKLTLLRNRS